MEQVPPATPEAVATKPTAAKSDGMLNEKQLDFLKKHLGFDDVAKNSSKLSGMFGKNGQVGKFVKEQSGTKLNLSPKNGICTCPICGDQHQHGGKGNAQPPQMA